MPSLAAGSDRFFNAGVYGANDGLTTIQVWPRLAGHSPYFRNGQPSEGAVQHKVRERRSMTVQQRCLDNLFLTRDNPHLLLACRISEEAAGKRARLRDLERVAAEGKGPGGSPAAGWRSAVAGHRGQ